MIATIQNILIEAGADFSRDIALMDNNGQPLSVSGLSANAALSTDVYANSVVAVFDAVLTDGNLNLHLSASVTEALTPGYYVYDAVVMGSGSSIFRIAEGIAVVDGGVTGVIQ